MLKVSMVIKSLFMVACCSARLAASEIVSEEKVVTTSFMQEFKRGGWGKPLKVSVSYHLLDNSGQNVPSNESLKDQVKQLIEAYPRPMDHLEVINKSIIEQLHAKYPNLESLKVTIEMAPDGSAPFVRKSTVEYKKTRLIEGFIITFKNQSQTQNQGLELELNYKYLGGLKAEEYPDYQDIRKSVQAFLDKPQNANLSGDALKSTLTKYLLEEFPLIDSLDIQIMSSPS